jgi:hypothetical protein
MPRPETSPFLFDYANTISLVKLREWGYMRPNTVTQGRINWSYAGQETASVLFKLNMSNDPKYFQLKYTIEGEAIEYKIKIASQPSNLGQGVYYYFICPVTFKRCRKLYFSGKYFVHREALQGMYSIQTRSKSDRSFRAVFDRMVKAEKIQDEINSKYFTTHYNGKRTRRFQKLLDQIEALNG